MVLVQLTGRASVNMAVIKYWGKRNEEMIHPTNDSLSMTLDTDDLSAKTTVCLSDTFTCDQMWLNGKEVSIQQNKRLVRVLGHLRSVSTSPHVKLNVRIVSENNFPTAAGLASSAAGYCCLVWTLGNLLGITDRKELGIVARMGSGSACRSIYGGFVQWVAFAMGEKESEHINASLPIQVFPQDHWLDVHVIVMVVEDHQKEVSSSDGMKRSIETSSFMKQRLEIVPDRIDRMKEAISNKDFSSFAEIMMKDSNSFHSICMDTYPPIRYLNETSWKIIHLIHSINDMFEGNICGYTFDAGPNACIFVLDQHVPLVASIINHFFPSVDPIVKGKPLPSEITPSDVQEKLTQNGNQVIANQIKYLIHTGVGSGPDVMHGAASSLIDEDGNPKSVQAH